MLGLISFDTIAQINLYLDFAYFLQYIEMSTFEMAFQCNNIHFLHSLYTNCGSSSPLEITILADAEKYIFETKHAYG